MKLLAKFVLILLPVFSQAQITVNGVMDEQEYRIIGVANSNNGFGSNDDLGILKYYSDATTLYIGITCRLTSNNNVVLFFDDQSYSGRGSSTLAGNTGWSNTGVFRTPNAGITSCGNNSGGLDGAIMDYECMDADYVFAFNEGGNTNNFYLDAMRLTQQSDPNGYFAGGYIGETGNQTGIAATVNTPFGPLNAITGTMAFAYRNDYDPVLNPMVGIEFSIPYASMPLISAGDHARFFVLLTNGDGLASNECIPGDLEPSGNPGCDFDFSTVTGQTFCTFPDIVLPLSFLSTSSRLQNDNTTIQWSVVQDVEAVSYMVERSHTGTTFTAIGSVPAQQQKDIASYSFSDKTSPAGKNYYRIKAILRSGTAKYSAITAVENNKGIFFVYPNPAEGRELTIHTGGLIEGLHQLSVWNTSGQPVYRTIIQLPALTITKKVALPQHLPAGTYYVQLQAGNSSFSEPFILMTK